MQVLRSFWTSSTKYQLQHIGHQSDIKLHTATHLGTIYSYTKSFAYSQFCWPPGFKQTFKKHKKKKPLWYLCVLMHFHLLQFPKFCSWSGSLWSLKAWILPDSECMSASKSLCPMMQKSLFPIGWACLIVYAIVCLYKCCIQSIYNILYQ